MDDLSDEKLTDLYFPLRLKGWILHRRGGKVNNMRKIFPLRNKNG